MIARVYRQPEPQPQYCQICVQGCLDQRWAAWFDGLTMSHTESGQTVLSGQVEDQAALRGVLGKVMDMNLTLISVACRPSSSAG